MTAEVVTADRLVDLVRPHLDTWCLGFDIDGVLAPIVDHADQSSLTDGVWDALERLGQRASVAVVSGRSLESLERLFALPTSIDVLGSHGLERRGQVVALDEAEQAVFEQLDILGTKTVEAIGDGAWLERKVASVAVHTREADPATSAEAVTVLQRLAGMVDGAMVKPGSEVVELLARHGNKGDAFAALARQIGKPPGFFIGDDVTDEDAFAAVAADGVSVRVGDGDTAATHRLANADEAARFVIALASEGQTPAS